MTRIAVLGAGAWGTAFGQVLADAGNDVMMWAMEPEIVESINREHTNPARLPDAKRLPDNMHATGNREEAVRNAEIVIVAIAAQFARVALEEFRPFIPRDAVVVSLMKGIEKSTGKRMDEVVIEVVDIEPELFAAVSGPNLSKEVALRQPAGAVVACIDRDTAAKIARCATNDYFMMRVSDDVIGLELCGSLKNVTAVAVGMARGAGYGENTAAMLQTQGLEEMMNLGLAMGAKSSTFAGLAGVGDLIATCGSSLSRNYTFGANLGKGMTVEEATQASNGVAEGVPTVYAVVELGKKYGVPTPLAYAMRRVLDDGISCQQMMIELFKDYAIGE